MSQLFRLKKFIGYHWKAKTKYYLHSPFVYQFYLNVLEGTADENLDSIHLLREKLQTDYSIIEIEDYGTGKSSSSISVLEADVAVRRKYGVLLYRLVKYFKPQNILELGTSIGISSSYLAAANPKVRIVSLEGSDKLSELARRNHSAINIQNVEVVSGNFDVLLPAVLDKIPVIDFGFFDGNHRKTATLKYFEQCVIKTNENSVFVFDDISRDKEMSEAWEAVKAHQKVTLTLEVFPFGICFFRKGKLAKENFVLRY